MDDIRKQTTCAVRAFLEQSNMNPGEMLVIGCSSSEVAGRKIGSASSVETANAIIDGLWPIVSEYGMYIAAQCCEHLNRALVVEEKTAKAYNLTVVCAKPCPAAGGAFASGVYNRMDNPVLVESIQAHAGIDIGGTLIGMHLRPVAVPVRIPVTQIGEALLICARTRPKYIGGPRTKYETYER